jgi:hypothetical protein
MMNALIAYANSAADRWGAWIVAASLDSAVLLALFGLVWLAIRHRVAPQVGYWLFVLVPLKLLVPVVMTVPVTVAQWTPSAIAASWFQGEPPIAVMIESRTPVKSQIASLGPDQPVRPKPAIETDSVAEPLVANIQQSNSPAEPRSAWHATIASAPAHPASEAPRSDRRDATAIRRHPPLLQSSDMDCQSHHSSTPRIRLR